MEPVMLDYLDTEIEKRRAEIAKIKAEQQELRQREHDFGVELRVLEDIRARSIRDETPAPLAGTTVNASQINTPAGPTPTVTRSKLAAHWRVVLRAAVERFPEGIKTQEVPEIQRAAGHDASPAPNVRSHFHKLRHEGLYEEAGWGTVRATKAAAELLGIPLGNTKQNTGTPNGQSLFGEPDRETAGRAHEANPAASFHH
jgi:hypothetical protein